MVDTVKLSKKIEQSGLTITALAAKSGMSRETFYNRMAGKSDFKASEITALTVVLQLSRAERDAIFFDN